MRLRARVRGVHVVSAHVLVRMRAATRAGAGLWIHDSDSDLTADPAGTAAACSRSTASASSPSRSTTTVGNNNVNKTNKATATTTTTTVQILHVASLVNGATTAMSATLDPVKTVLLDPSHLYLAHPRAGRAPPGPTAARVDFQRVLESNAHQGPSV